MKAAVFNSELHSGHRQHLVLQHSDKPPTYNSKKDEMKAWLLERNIPFCDVLKAQLYDLIKVNKPKHKCYVTDQLLAGKKTTVC
jgi:hypothetical protein